MVGFRQGVGEFRSEIPGSCVEVRLKYHSEPLARIEFLDGTDRGPHFVGAVGIVIDEYGAPLFLRSVKPYLEPAPGSAELREPSAHLLLAGTGHDCGGGGGHGVVHVYLDRNSWTQILNAQSVGTCKREGDLTLSEAYILGVPVSLGASAVGGYAYSFRDTWVQFESRVHQ